MTSILFKSKNLGKIDKRVDKKDNKNKSKLGISDP